MLEKTETCVRARFQPLINAVILYEDFALLERVDALLERLVNGKGSRQHAPFCVWNYAELTSPRQRDRAAWEVLNAETLFLIAGREHPFPDQVMKWFDDWRHRRQNFPIEVVALTDPDSAPFQASPPWLSYLSAATATAGIALCRCEAERAASRGSGYANNSQERRTAWVRHT